MPEAGFEPARPCEQWILNPSCLPGFTTPACAARITTRPVLPFHRGVGRPILLGPMNIEKSLAEIGDRLNKARNDLRIVEEQLLFQMDVMEDAKTRALVAETPLADREYRTARDDHDRLVRQREEAQRDILELQREQDRLLDRMLGSGSKV